MAMASDRVWAKTKQQEQLLELPSEERRNSNRKATKESIDIRLTGIVTTHGGNPGNPHCPASLMGLP